MFCLFALIAIQAVSKWMTVEAADISYMKSSISNYFSDTRHHDPAYMEYKAKAKEYIYNEFIRLGLSTEYHTFKDTTVSHTATFQNVIGVLKGERFGSANDTIVGVGAHYDTVTTTKGVDDNGAGVAAMLEVVKQITDMNKQGVKRQNTVIFASFDLKEYGDLSGSRHLITSWVPQWLESNYGSHRPTVAHGFIIMDTVMEFNTSAHSQTLPEGAQAFFKTTFPNTSASIESDNFEGDFINLIYRGNTPEANLAMTFRNVWKKEGREKYELEQFKLPFQNIDDLPVNKRPLFNNFARSDHFNFWKNNLPAIFLTDSGNFRGDMIQCYHHPCDNLDVMLTEDNINFLGKTADVITQTIHQLSGPSGVKSSFQYWLTAGVVSVILVVISLVAVLLYKRYGNTANEHNIPCCDILSGDEHNIPCCDILSGDNDTPTEQ